MPFFRQLQHLLPRGKAWQTTVDKTLRQVFVGLAGSAATVRTFIDEVWEDALPSKTRELDTWEYQFGLTGLGTDGERRTDIDTAWKATGGQSPAYIQGILQAAGFDAYVHEWWQSGPPYVARDPRQYTQVPTIGTYQCTDAALDQPECSLILDPDGESLDQPQCDAFLSNDPGYLVNKTLTLEPPPPVPDDPDTWPYFLYIAGENFPNPAFIPDSRRLEFERLLLKLCPTQNWIVYITSPTDDGELGLFMFDAGDGWNASIWENK